MEPEIPAIALANMLFSERAGVVIRLVGRTGPHNSERKWNESKANFSVKSKKIRNKN